jgi:hypothetical protein
MRITFKSIRGNDDVKIGSCKSKNGRISKNIPVVVEERKEGKGFLFFKNHSRTRVVSIKESRFPDFLVSMKKESRISYRFSLVRVSKSVVAVSVGEVIVV